MDQCIQDHHCMKCVEIRSFFGSYFPAFGLNTKRYEVFLRIQSECGKIRTRKKLRIRTLFTQCISFQISIFLKVVFHKLNWSILEYLDQYISLRFCFKGYFSALYTVFGVQTPFENRNKSLLLQAEKNLMKFHKCKEIMTTDTHFLLK